MFPFPSRITGTAVFTTDKARQSIFRAAISTGLGSLICLLAAGPASGVEFQPVAGFGVEYNNEVKVNASARLKIGNLPLANYYFLESTVTLNNTDNAKKNLVICVYGYSKAFDNEVRRTNIDMTFDNNQKVLGCALTQEQVMSKRRYGQMGCRQVTLAENEKGRVVRFVSGNNRTTIKKVGVQWQVDRIGPVQDGEKDAAKIIAAGGAGAGGHPLVSPNTIDGKREKMDSAIRGFVTRLILSEDANVKLDETANTFNCNKCFGMGSTLGDPEATRTDFLLNLPSDNIKMQAKLKVATQYDSLKDILLKAGAKTQAPFDLLNESSETAFVTITSLLVELPSACTVQLLRPEPEPISLPPLDSKPAILEFDCGPDLEPGAGASVSLSMNSAGTGELLGNYLIRARNSVNCDVNSDGSVNIDDLQLIMAYRNNPAFEPDDPYDVDDDGQITVNDVRICSLQCTKPGCVP